MADISTSWVMAQPSFTLPDIVVQYQQASGAPLLLATGFPMVRLSDGDLYVYAKRINLRTKVNVSQARGNALPSCTIETNIFSTPTYMVATRAEYDHHDVAATSRWGYSVVDAQRLAMRQGTFQQLRAMLLYGNVASNGEGLLNANGATTVSLPPDMNGNTTVATYDNGAMAFFLISQVTALKSRTMQMGIGQRFAICGPQRTLGAFEYQDIVQVTQFQREGAGSLSTKGVMKEVLLMNGDTLEWTYDDTLIGKGAGGADAVVLTMPEVKKVRNNKINTNEFAELTPGLDATTAMFMDMPAPREIPTPLPGGAIDVVSELRASCGWGIRPEAITIMSIQYQ